jgi:hypothetical protein
MPRRYAVLWSLEHDRSIPVGIAVDQGDHVLVDVPDHFCVPARQRGDYYVIQPDSMHVKYRPGDDGYFDQALLELSRQFAIGEQGELPGDDAVEVVDLLRRKVLEPLASMEVREYSLTSTRTSSYQAAPLSYSEVIGEAAPQERMRVGV